MANVDDRNPVIDAGVGLVVGNPTGGNLGPGTINIGLGGQGGGVFVDGVAIAGGLAVPNAVLIGGNGSALSAVTLGENLAIVDGVLNASGGASLPPSSPLLGSTSQGAGQQVTLDPSLSIISNVLTPQFGTASGTFAAGNDVRLNQFSASTPGIVPLSGGGTSTFLRADGTWASAGGGGSLPASAPLVGSNSGATGVTVTPSNGLSINGSSQLVPTFGTSVNTFAQGNDSRIVGAAQVSNNLSDLASATTARTNLGLGTAAVASTGTSGGVVPLLNGTNTWSAVQTHSAALNVTAAAGFQQYGVTVVNTGTTTGTGFVAIGPLAGASLSVTDQFAVAVGPSALQNATGGNENTAVGSRVLQFLTSGNANTGMGVGSLAYEVTGNGNSSYGNDNMRNVVGALSNSSIGWYAVSSGSPKNCVGVGANAITGNSASVILGGSVTTGDIITLTLTGSFTGSPVSVTATAGGGSTLATLGTALVNAINSNSTLNAVPGRVLAVDNTTPTGAFGIQFTGTSTNGLSIVVTSSVSGSATETVTIGGGNFGQNLTAVGANAMPGLSITTASHAIAVGAFTLQALTTGNDIIAIGRQAGQSVSTSTSCVLIGSLAGSGMTTGINNIFIGQSAGTLIGTGFNNVVIGVTAGSSLAGSNAKNNVLIGEASGLGVTTGAGNTLIGASTVSASTGQVTTGGNNIAIGKDVAVASPTASGQLCIGNYIYGISLTGSGATLSSGKIGIGTIAPNAALTIGDSTGTKEAHFGVLQTTAPTVVGGTIDSHASDVCGTVTGGTTVTSIAITFNQTWATVPHAVVTARDGLTFTYTVSQTVLTISFSSATGRVFDYVCIQ